MLSKRFRGRSKKNVSSTPTKRKKSFNMLNEQKCFNIFLLMGKYSKFLRMWIS